MNTPLRTHSLAQALAAAARTVVRVLEGGSASTALESLFRNGPANLRAAARDLSHNALRAYGVSDVIAASLLSKPAEPLVRALLQVAITELSGTGADPRAPHAIVHQAVEAVALLRRERAKGLVNAVLRSFLRERAALLSRAADTEPGRWRHPQWWIDRIRSACPQDWEAVMESSSTHPPMCLRVNLRKTTLERYRAALDTAGLRHHVIAGFPAAVQLKTPVPVHRLPGFLSGEVSVQDAGAQLAAPLLDLRPGMRVLDACAAPGGKTAHILELADCDLLAVDIAPERAMRIRSGLSRLGLEARVLVGDVGDAGFAPDEPDFDRILLDAPCTASGVSRRHPDIRWLRRESDIAGFARQQKRLLAALWRRLRPGGKLLYATCSLFPEENGLQIAEFLADRPDASLLRIELPAPGSGRHPGAGVILPGPDTDGFFYALLMKAHPVRPSGERGAAREAQRAVS